MLVLGLFEGGLRLCGYGYSTRFFVKMGDGKTLTTNRKFGWRFHPREIATQPYPVLMPAQKPPGTIRIFVLGESAAQGSPAPSFGFARILGVMLERQFPDQRFEIINAAMRGINSHAILPIARECARYSPDLFLIYMGNNEAIGLYAPEPEGFNFTPYLRLLRAGQCAKGTKVAQLMDNLIRAARKNPPKRPEQDMAFFRKHRLPPDTLCRVAVCNNFRMNVKDICRATQASGAKVIASTVAVNLQDFPPLGSLHRAGLTAADLSSWDAVFAKGTNAEAGGRFAEAITNYLEAARVDDHFAELHFRLARCHLAAGQFEPARRHFESARDWDALAFRTDSRLNRIIREAAASRQGSGLFFVDAEQAFAEAAGDAKVPGSRFFNDHVHLTFDGDYLLAQTFLPMVVKALGLADKPATAGAKPPVCSRQECAAALAFTEWDEIGVTAAMIRATAKPPYLDQLDHAEWQAKAQEALNQRGQAFQQQDGFKRAAETYQAAIKRRPSDWEIHYNCGNFLNDFGNRPAAAAEFMAGIKIMPAFPPMRILFGQILWDTGKRSEAIEQFRETLQIAPDYAPAAEALARAEAIRQATPLTIPGSRGPSRAF